MLLGTIPNLTFYNETEKWRLEEQRGWKQLQRQLEQMLQENEKVRKAEANMQEIQHLHEEILQLHVKRCEVLCVQMFGSQI